MGSIAVCSLDVWTLLRYPGIVNNIAGDNVFHDVEVGLVAIIGVDLYCG